MTTKKSSRPRCLGRYVADDKRALAAAKAARRLLINLTANRLEEAVVRGWSTTRSQLMASFRAILEDVL